MDALALVIAKYPVTPDHWRWTMLVCTAPAFLAFVVVAFLPESPRWRKSVRESAARPLRRKGTGREPGFDGDHGGEQQAVDVVALRRQRDHRAVGDLMQEAALLLDAGAEQGEAVRRRGGREGRIGGRVEVVGAKSMESTVRRAGAGDQKALQVLGLGGGIQTGSEIGIGRRFSEAGRARQAMGRD